jgi:hypothetical protein
MRECGLRKVVGKRFLNQPVFAVDVGDHANIPFVPRVKVCMNFFLDIILL